MSNYVIPSIRSLDDMDHYSEGIQWDNFTYRIPKGLKLIAQKSLKDDAKMRRLSWIRYPTYCSFKKP